MIRAVIILIGTIVDFVASIIWLAVAIIALLFVISLISRPAHAKDNNPFSGATSISVEMTRDEPNKQQPNSGQKPFRLRCTLNGKPVADWRGSRIKLGREWSSVPPDAAGPMLVLLWAGGARCR